MLTYIYKKEDRTDMNKTGIILFTTMACGLVVSLMHNVRFTARLSRMESAVHMIDEKLCAVKPGTNETVRTSKNDSTIEIERKALHTAYQAEKADFNSSHKMIGGGRISYAMLCNAQRDFQNGWKSIVTNWFYSTARDDHERKWMKEYDVGVMDLKYSRDELKQVMYAWKSVSSGKGYFEKQDVHSLQTANMRARWNWFLRFRGGTIECYCHFKHVCDAFEGLRYNFEPNNDCIVITSIHSGDIIGELYLGSREYTYSRGKKSRHFEFSDSMAPKSK